MKNQESANRSKTVIFQLFEVEFAPISQPAEAQGGLFPDVPNANPTANPLEALGAILSTHTELTLPVVRKTKKGSIERKDYHADVLRSENNVTLVQPENLKVKKTILHRKENTHEHHPFCNVVVDLRNGHPNADPPPALPQRFELMQTLAARLSAGLPQVRIDFYELDGKVYFGEYTFYHWGGMVPFEPESFDLELGSYVKLEGIK